MSKSSARVIGAAGLAALLFYGLTREANADEPSGDDTPAPPPPPPPKPAGPVPASVLKRVVDALGTADPAKMRAEAAKLRADGWPLHAEDLERAANAIELLSPKPANTPPVVVKPPAPAPAPPVVVKPPAPAPAPPIVRVLKLGTTGADVIAWQMRLIADGFPLTADGTFGPVTDAATRDFQSDRGVPPDGMVTPATVVAALKPPQLGGRVLREGSHGGAVKLWQTRLLADGHSAVKTADGAFGPVTKAETSSWQHKRGLSPDGVVGTTTIAAMSKPAPAAPATVIVDPDKWRTMRRGTAGADVREWQQVLTRDGYPVALDGQFGPATETATKQWQASRGLPADGVVTPAVREQISDYAAKPGARVAGDVAMPDHLPLRAVSPLPGILPARVPTEVVAPDRALAARLAAHLFNVQPGQESRELVAQFQRANGVGATSAYGPATALALVPFGIVPPKPFYWPRKGIMRAKAAYRLTLLEQSKRDPQRADEWSSASNV